MFEIKTDDGKLSVEFADGRMVEIGNFGSVEVIKAGECTVGHSLGTKYILNADGKEMNLFVPLDEKYVILVQEGEGPEYFYPYDPNIGLNEVPYEIVFWEDEEAREIGESSLEGFYEDFNEAYLSASQLYYNHSYPAVEILATDSYGNKDVVARWSVDVENKVLARELKKTRKSVMRP